MCNAYNHPPGCTCGWGGEGHLGRSDGGWSYTFPRIETPSRSYWSGVTREWREPDFTRPTTCPECGADVFFIRHNGGSVWIDPPLGPPWDKHPCFDKPYEPTRSFGSWTLKSSGLTKPKLGVIRRISGSKPSSEPTIHIELTDSTTVSLVLRWTPSDASMVGSLVIISEDDRMLLHPKYAEISFHSLARLEPVARHGWYFCQRCKAQVRHGTGHEEHCRKHYQPKPVPKTHPQEPPVPHHQQKRHPTEPVTAPSAPPRDRPHPQLAAAAAARDANIQSEVNRITAEAWEATAGLPPDARLKSAKQHALRLIATLSPTIKRDVEHRLTSSKWSPLLSLCAKSSEPPAQALRPTPLNWPLPSPPE